MLRVENISKKFGKLKAVDSVSFDICHNDTVGLVGESGCGKTTIARMICGLYRPDYGSIVFNGTDSTDLSRKQRAAFVQMVFQNPFTSLDERCTVKQILLESMHMQKSMNNKQKFDYAASLLEQVGLCSHILASYPHQLSGGQRQRVAIARALAPKPKFIVLDEPTSALDANTAVMILELLENIQQETNVSYLLISHDLKLVRHIAKRVVVMRSGRLVEQGEAQELWVEPKEHYTKELIAASRHELI